MINCILIWTGKLISFMISSFNLGTGATWPGHIALRINPLFIKQMISKSKLKIIIITGTNGKTTTASMLTHILYQNGYKVIQNSSGANLLNGIASTLIMSASIFGNLKGDYGIFEIDENVIPKALMQMNPDFLILLNLFRDQLDRYGEIWSIADRWNTAIKKLSDKTRVILNADDPQIAYLGITCQKQTAYFGLNEKHNHIEGEQYAADSLYCPPCGQKLDYHIQYFSHLGDYSCKVCGFKRPLLKIDQCFYPLVGAYNKYNTLAATSAALEMGLTESLIDKAIQSFTPVFGRQEVIDISGKRVQLFLAKNPTSFNESYETIKKLGANLLCISLNDRVHDAIDVSWIWDVDFEQITQFRHISLTGDRLYDMALRLKYEDCTDLTMYPNPRDAIDEALLNLNDEETLFILPTYTAMLDIREILTKKRIL
jgi:UDP-N-acetylmuramyl tripeptide synthase